MSTCRSLMVLPLICALCACKMASVSPPQLQLVPQIDPETYVHENRTYSVVHHPVAEGTFEVEVAGLARVLTSASADRQLAVDVGARFLSHRELCGDLTVPTMVRGTQTFDATHEYWKQTFRCL